MWFCKSWPLHVACRKRIYFLSSYKINSNYDLARPDTGIWQSQTHSHDFAEITFPVLSHFTKQVFLHFECKYVFFIKIIKMILKNIVKIILTIELLSWFIFNYKWRYVNCTKHNHQSNNVKTNWCIFIEKYHLPDNKNNRQYFQQGANEYVLFFKKEKYKHTQIQKVQYKNWIYINIHILKF